jgi:hypothetical protein
MHLDDSPLGIEKIGQSLLIFAFPTESDEMKEFPDEIISAPLMAITREMTGIITERNH